MFEIRGLRGVLPALITPLNPDGTVDEPGVRRLVEHVLAGGVHGLLPLGSTGETASLDEPARRLMLSAAVAAAAGRVPVICGVAQSHIRAASAELDAATEAGASAALVAPPFYYPIDQPTVLAFYRELAAENGLPMMLYNIPQFTKVVAEPATVAKLAHEGTIVGIKDSSRDFEYFENVCAATRDIPEFRIFTGSDSMLLASLAMGGSGTICGAANVAPAWVVEIYDAFHSGNLEAARSRQDDLLALVTALRAGVFPAAIKAAVHLQGVTGDTPAAPVAPLSEPALGRLRDQLGAWGLLPSVANVG